MSRFILDRVVASNARGHTAMKYGLPSYSKVNKRLNQFANARCYNCRWGLVPCLFVSGCVVLVPFVQPYQEPEPKYSFQYSDRSSSAAGRSSSNVTSSLKWVRRYEGQLKDLRPAIRAAAASYLGMMGSASAPAVPALTTRLKDDSKYVRRAAAKALGKIGAPARPALAALKNCTHDVDPFVARSAEWAIRQLQP